MTSKLRAGVRGSALAALAAGAIAWTSTPAAAQSVVDRSPNLSGGWIAAPGVVQFNFLHRFTQSGPPQRKVVSSPSFHLAAGLPWSTMLGVKYATHSDVVPTLPNEWAFFGRYSPWTEAGGAPLDLAAEIGYNLAAQSVDGELTLARQVGPLRLIGAARALSNAYDAGEARYAVSGGASVRLLEGLALAGDVASLLERTDEERVAWGAGVQLRIPYTPHTLSLHATNANTATLQGTSRGSAEIRYGFEFTIPVTLRRYLPLGEPAAEPPVAGEAGETAVAAFAATDTVIITMQGLQYDRRRVEIVPGTTVVWRNEDVVIHTATDDGGGWDSGEIEPGASWSRTFDSPGTYAYHCTPHPFMTAAVVVRQGGSDR